jgi:outer membrane receptor protein involved in Fe transport
MKLKNIAIAIVSLLWTSSLHAQQVIIMTDSTEVPELNISEVQIKASKTNLGLKQLPASVTLLNSMILEQTDVRSLTDISAIAPGFFMPDYGSKLTSPVYIRGIGSRINSPSVGLYVDHVPYFEKAAFNFDFFDIDRIEILKGPQGTLYGRNTMGGIINIITRSPLDFQGTSVELEAGSYGSYAGNIGHYGKAGDDFAYSFAFNVQHHQGYYTNMFSGEQVDRSSSIGGRNKLIWTISDRWKVENILSVEYSTEGGYPYALLNDSLMAAEQINYNQPSSYARNLVSDGLVLNYSGNHIIFTSTTSYQYLDDIQEIDQDFTPDSLYFVVQDQLQHMVSQEFIFRSAHPESRYSWLTGAYGFTQRFSKQVDVEVYASDMVMRKGYHNSVTGAALFHQSTFNDFLLKDLSLTAGIRADFERDDLDYLYNMEHGSSTIPMADTTYPELSYVEILPKIALSYRTGSFQVYATAAKGYKTGGFNSTFETDSGLYYRPETSWNYETGFKGSLLNRHLYLDVALFYIDWNNQQIYQSVPSGRGARLSNAGESVSKGFELTLKTLPVRGFKPVLSYGYTDARFIKYEKDANTNYNGNVIPFIPRHTLNFVLRKSIDLHQAGLIDRVEFNLVYRGLGKIYWNEENTFSTNYYNLVDANIAFAKSGFELALWGKNLLGTDYESFYFEALGNQYVQTGKPLRFGVNLKYEF